MRRVALLTFPLLLTIAGCGDDYQPEQLYLATSPDCREWVDGSTFRLPEGVSVSATTPVTVKEGSAEFGVVYLVPRGGRVQFVTRAFNITQPKGATIAKAKEGAAEYMQILADRTAAVVGSGRPAHRRGSRPAHAAR